jgi:DNA-binding GntR family transcriptional regulator
MLLSTTTFDKHSHPFSIHLDRCTPIPLHHQLTEQVRALIRDGSLPAGAALPPEPDLADALGISRTTIRQAIAPLVREGLLLRERGRGTFVQEPANRCPTCGAFPYSTREREA